MKTVMSRQNFDQKNKILVNNTKKISAQKSEFWSNKKHKFQVDIHKKSIYIKPCRHIWGLHMVIVNLCKSKPLRSLFSPKKINRFFLNIIAVIGIISL